MNDNRDPIDDLARRAGESLRSLSPTPDPGAARRRHARRPFTALALAGAMAVGAVAVSAAIDDGSKTVRVSTTPSTVPAQTPSTVPAQTTATTAPPATVPPTTVPPGTSVPTTSALPPATATVPPAAVPSTPAPVNTAPTPILTRPRDATNEVLTLLGTPPPQVADPAQLAQRLADVLATQGDTECPTKTTAVVSSVEESPIEAGAVVEQRVGCDDSVRGAVFEIRMLPHLALGWVVDSATRQDICRRGFSGDELCV